MGPPFAVQFNYIDLRKRCMSTGVLNFLAENTVLYMTGVCFSFSVVYDYPQDGVRDPGVGFFKDQFVVCGGKFEGGAFTDRCYGYKHNSGWSMIGTYPNKT